jgi:hypothetical protein
MENILVFLRWEISSEGNSCPMEWMVDHTEKNRKTGKYECK